MRTFRLDLASSLVLLLAACGGAEAPAPSGAPGGGGSGGGPIEAPVPAASTPAPAPPVDETTKADFVLTAPTFVVVRPGQTSALPIEVVRPTGFDGEITLTIGGLPQGAQAGGATIPAGAKKATIAVTADPAAKQARALVTIKAALGALEATASTSIAIRGVAGEVDATFGASGRAELPTGGRLSELVVLPDGRVLAGGNIEGDAVIARFSSLGELDGTFGEQGIARVPRPEGHSDNLRRLRVLADGRIVVSGERTVDAANLDRGLVARFDADGKLDASFGSGGVLAVDALAGADTSFGGGVFEAADGSLFATGYTSLASKCNVLVEKLHTNGSPDEGYGPGGVRRIEPPVAPDADLCTTGGVPLADGGFVLSGTAYVGSKMAAVRFDAQGDLDTSFGSGGFTLVGAETAGAWSSSIAVAPGGKLVLAGYVWSSDGMEMTFARLNAGGGVDSTFGNAGLRTVDVGPLRSAAYAVTVAADGSVLAAGWSEPAQNEYRFAVVRLAPNGDVDGAFGTGGSVLAPGAGTSYALALDANGRLFAGTYFPDTKRGGIVSLWQ